MIGRTNALIISGGGDLPEYEMIVYPTYEAVAPTNAPAVEQNNALARTVQGYMDITYPTYSAIGEIEVYQTADVENLFFNLAQKVLMTIRADLEDDASYPITNHPATAWGEDSWATMKIFDGLYLRCKATAVGTSVSSKYIYVSLVADDSIVDATSVDVTTYTLGNIRVSSVISSSTISVSGTSYTAYTFKMSKAGQWTGAEHTTKCLILNGRGYVGTTVPVGRKPLVFTYVRDITDDTVYTPAFIFDNIIYIEGEVRNISGLGARTLTLSPYETKIEVTASQVDYTYCNKVRIDEVRYLPAIVWVAKDTEYRVMKITSGTYA